jgi:hypothetical protein
MMTKRRLDSWLSLSAIPVLLGAIASSGAIAQPLLFAQTETPVEVEEPLESSEEAPEELELPEELEEPIELELPEDEETPEAMEEEDEWEEFTYDDAGFRVALPATPVEEMVPANPDLGMGESGAILLDTNGNTVGYAAFYRDYPDLATLESSEAIATFLDDFRDDFIANGVLDGQLLQEREIMLDSYPGREMEIIGAEGFLKTRVYLVGDRLYMLVAVSMTEEAYPETGDRFLDSFELVN